MAFVDHVRQVLTEAMPEKYPVMVGQDFCAVDAVHDDYADLRYGSIYDANGETDTVAVSDYVRSTALDSIKSVQPLPDWRVIRMPSQIA